MQWMMGKVGQRFLRPAAVGAGLGGVYAASSGDSNVSGSNKRLEAASFHQVPKETLNLDRLGATGVTRSHLKQATVSERLHQVEIVVFTGGGDNRLARGFVNELKAIMPGVEIREGRCTVGKFSDGETQIHVHESLRSPVVDPHQKKIPFIFQELSPNPNDRLAELELMADGIRRSGGENITAITPYFAYGRADRRPASAKVPISAQVIANRISNVGIKHLYTVDVHAPQIEGFFPKETRFEDLYASKVLFRHLKNKMLGKQLSLDSTVIVSPDLGGGQRARKGYAEPLNLDLVQLEKRRPGPNVAEVLNIIGDPDEKDCVIVDDLSDTSGTLIKAAEALKAAGARSVHVLFTHPVLSGPAIERLASAPIETLVFTDTIPLSEAAKSNQQFMDKVEVVSVAPLIAEAVMRSLTGRSISAMYKRD